MPVLNDSRASDFNDMAHVAGLDAVAEKVNKAQPVNDQAQHWQPLGEPEVDYSTMPPETIGGDGTPPDKDDSPLAPPVMSREGFPGILGDIVAAATVSSEAHPVAVAANVLSFFCCSIGRVAFQRIGDATIHPRPYFLIVGRSGKARKGTSEFTVREIFKRADEILRKKHASNDRLRIHSGGLSTGEGIAYAIRDPKEPDEKTGKGGDVGIEDKRLLVIESEFANVLAQIKREGNTLSATIRNLWDGRPLEPLTKSSQVTASNPHVLIAGHITSHELKEKSTENDAANGLLNRFVILHVQRPKLVPLPQPTPVDVLDALANRMADAIDSVTLGDPHKNNRHEVKMTKAARDVWTELYPRITQDAPGMAGSLMARSEVYCRMLAMVFALLDSRAEINPDDLLTAQAWVEYWRRSIEYVFLTGETVQELSDFDQKVLKLVTDSPGVKLSELQEHWKRKRTQEVKDSLEKLLNLAPPLIEMRRDESTGGRVAKRYYRSGA